jgi:hypothetical protein
MNKTWNLALKIVRGPNSLLAVPVSMNFTMQGAMLDLFEALKLKTRHDFGLKRYCLKPAVSSSFLIRKYVSLFLPSITIIATTLSILERWCTFCFRQ